ncbi:fimbria/pilus outer membrane usher protein [Morganella morganii]|uniref:fimbria/pilus outer membrane usher protein n=1 Tax=Morganella morganii TaxID=582 RepID=UPI0032DAA5C5
MMPRIKVMDRFNAVARVTVLISLSVHIHYVWADDYFLPEFIEVRGNSGHNVDISRFSKSDGQLPGVYHVTVYMNNSLVEPAEINFASDESNLIPVLTRSDYIKWGVSPAATPAWMKLQDNAEIKDIGNLLPGAKINFQFDEMRLNISIPQEFIKHIPQGAVDPALWDDGLNMLFLNYNLTGASNRGDDYSGNDIYINVRSGLNIGAWRIRNYSTYNKNNTYRKWDTIGTYLERDIRTLKSRVFIGEGYTQAGVFDSISFRGAMVYTDDSMLPESVRGFAPVVRGIAQSNAQVTIRQGGNVIWQSYVPPGPFLVDDLYPTSASGDLDVIIREADGSIRQFIQPFSALPMMLREKQYKYSLAAGKYRAENSHYKEPAFLQGTLSYGLPGGTTLYGGAQVAEEYWAGVLGIGRGLGDFGSLSFDVTTARTQTPAATDLGGSLRVQYAKDFTATGTTLSLMGYRYSSSGFHDFKEATGDVDLLRMNRDQLVEDESWRYGRNKRSKAQLTLNQRLDDWGNMNVSFWQQDYWGGDTERNVNVGYNFNISNISYGLNYSFTQGSWHNDNDHIVSLTAQIPFARFVPDSWMTFSANSNIKGNTYSQVGMSGTALEDRTLAWNIQQGYNNKDSNINGNAFLNYRGNYGEYQLGYNYSGSSHQVVAGATGGVVIHPYGISASQPLGETLALIKADDAADIRIINNNGVYTDSKGFAVVPYVTPYRKNTLSLDTLSLKNNTDILNDTSTVIPTKGALVLAEFPTVTGYRAIIRLTGKKIPFGASVHIENENNIQEGIVDDNNSVWLSGIPEKGILVVDWGGGKCLASYKIIQPSEKTQKVTAQCRSEGGD